MDITSPFAHGDSPRTHAVHWSLQESPVSPRSSYYGSDTADGFERIELRSMARASAEVPLLPSRRPPQTAAPAGEPSAPQSPTSGLSNPASSDPETAANTGTYVPHDVDTFGKREICLELFLGAVCGTVCGIYWGSMLGSLWGSQSEAQSLRTSAPAGLGLGTLIGGIVALVKWRKSQRSAFTPV